MVTTPTKKETEVGAEERLRVAGALKNGICSTCNLGPSCAHLIKNPDLAVWECENFDAYLAPPARGAARAAAEPDYGRLKGLCMNCADVETCTFPRPEGGVWHCAEYKA